MELTDLKNILERKKGQREQIELDIFQANTKINTLKKEIEYSEKAQAIIQLIAQQTQKELEYHISDIVSSALDTIFNNPYKFKAEFITKRNRPECNLSFIRNGEEIQPLSASGGGVVDSASFALRIACWALQTPKSRPIIILDEPFKFLSKELLPRASELIKELSSKLELQFIIITHLDELTENADRIFKVNIKKGVSKCQQMSL